MGVPPGQLRRLLVFESKGWTDPYAVHDRLRELAEVHGPFEIVHDGDVEAVHPSAVLIYWNGVSDVLLVTINDAFRLGVPVEIHTPAL